MPADDTPPPPGGDGLEAAVDGLYRQCMELLHRCRALELATRERERPDPNQALAETEVRLRTTCSLTSALAWLSGQKAVFGGEIAAAEAPDFEPPPRLAGTADSYRAHMAEDLLALEREAETLLARAETLAQSNKPN